METPAPSPAAAQARAAPVRRRRWPRRLAWTAAVLAVLLTAALFVLSRPAVLTPLVRGQLAETLRAEVTLDRATLSVRGVLTLHGLAVSLPEDAVPEGEPEAAEYRRLLNLDRLTLRIGRRDLLRGRVNLKRIEVTGPTLHAVMEGPRGKSNLRAWADRFRDGRPLKEDGGPVSLPPEIFVRDAALELVQLDAETSSGAVFEVVTRHRLGFDGTVIPQGAGLGAKLAFELTGRAAPGAAAAAATGTEVSGSWTPSRQELVLSVERMDLASPLGLLMPPEFRTFWRDLDPAGALPALTVETRLDRTGTERLQRARLEVAGLSFRLPLASLELLPEGESQRDAPRMSDVSGSVVLEDGRIASDGLSGEIEGIRVRIAGSADLVEGGEVSLVAETEAFDVPATPPLLFRLPGLISQIYNEYRPSGRFAARVKVSREAGGPVGIDGRVEVIDARVVFHAFPYPVEGMEGVLLLDRDTLRIRGLSANGPDGGRVVLDGDITEPGPNAGIDLGIRVEDVPLDETLLAAMDADLRERVRGFFDVASAQRLADASPEAEEPFAPGGRLRGVVRVLRDTAIRPKSWIELDLDPEGLRVMLPAFAYPLTVRSGSLRTGPEELRLNDFVVTGPTGGAGVIRGRVGLPEGDAPPEIDIRLVDFSLPIDRHLLGAIEPDAASWLRRLGITGRIVGGGLVGSAAEGAGRPTEPGPGGEDRIGVQLDLRLAEGRAALWGGDATLTGVQAGARVTRDVVRIDRLRAAWPGGGTLTGEGRIEAPGGRLRLDFEAEAIRFDAAVARMIPPESPARAAALDFFETYDLSGTADGSLVLRTRSVPAGGDASPIGVSLDVRPTAVSALYGGRRVALNGVSGRILIDEDAATLANLSGATPTGSVDVSGRVPFDDLNPTWLRIDAEGDTSDPVLLAFAPAAVRDAADGVELGGRMRIEDATLRLGPTPEDAPSDATLPFAFESGVLLTDATATLGVPVTDANLAARVRAVGGGDALWPDVKLVVGAPRLVYGSRVVERLRFTGNNRDRPTVVRLEGVDASVYGGVLAGGVEVRVGPDDRPGGPPPGAGSFAVDLRLSGAEAESVLYPEDVAAPPAVLPVEPRIAALPPLPPPRSAAGGPPRGAPPRLVTAAPEDRERAAGGRLWAALTAAGEAGLPDTLEGRGRVRIRGGDLLKGQRGIGLLRAINLALPTSEPLGDADGRFVLVDGQVRVEDAVIRGASLSLNGRGSIDLPGGELYLTFFSRVETNRWLRGIKRLFDSIKDEFIGIEVGGTLWEPDARVTGLTGLRGSVDERMGETAAPRTSPATPAAAPVTTPPAR